VDEKGFAPFVGWENTLMNLQLLCAQAVGLHQKGNLSDAEGLYLQIIAVEPNHFTALHLLGIIRYQQGRNSEALTLIEAALRVNHKSAEALSNYANVLKSLRRFDEALASFDKALALRPNDSKTLTNRGITLLGLKRFDEALKNFDRALTINADYPEALNNRGIALHNLQRFKEALTNFDKALALKPGYFEALNNRGITLLDLGSFNEALESYDKALAIKPAFAEALNNRGIALHNLRRFKDALANFDKAWAIKPDYVEVLNNRGRTLLALERFDEALDSYEKALALKPDYAEALNNLGDALQCLQRFRQALAIYDRALTIMPDYAEALNGRGNSLYNLKYLDEALESYDKALAIKMNHAEALNNRAIVLQSMGRINEAAMSYAQAIAINPDNAEVYVNYGTLEGVVLRALEPAIEHLERAVALEPGLHYAPGFLLHLKMLACDWRNFEDEITSIDVAVRMGKKAIDPFDYLAISSSPADLKSCAITFNQHRYPATSLSPSPHSRVRRDKIRLGYMSGEFYEQATAYLMAGLYESHNREKFELVAFDNGIDDASATRRRLASAFGKFVGIKDLSDRDAAEKIRAEGIDILVNLNGYFGKHRTGVFAHRAAALQVNYLGFPGTMGSTYMDYIIADHIVLPEEESCHYTEQVVWLPDCYQANDSKRAIASAPPTRADCGLPENAFVFCNFNASYKINPTQFASWIRLLKQVDESVLWLLESNAISLQNLRREAMTQGVAPERLLFAPLIPLDKHLARLSLADLSLDTLPCNAHTTASDALWAGVPLLTCRGSAFSGRVAASLLMAVGLPELVTETMKEYEALAVELAHAPARLQALRGKLAQNRTTAPLFNTERFRCHIEAAYIQMWETFCKGEPPRSFSVQPQ
jgi:protein O-GlcNAc transferase